jgi:hypothetical protein
MRIGFILTFILTGISSILQAQAPAITPRSIPSPGEVYTFKFIKDPGVVDTSLVGENLIWDFRKLKDTATYYEEVYRESTPSQNEIFEESYSLDSTNIDGDLLIWVNYLDSTKYYRLGAFEKPSAPMSDQPYFYPDTILLFTFPFQFGNRLTDRYEFIKAGRKHHKNQFINANIKFDAYGTLILPNNDTCYQAVRIRREEKFYNMVNDQPQLMATKTYFLWYDASKPNVFVKVVYVNGIPFEAWFQKKKSFIKKKRSSN